MKRLLFLGCVLPAALLSCAVPEKIDESYHPVGRHEEYRQALVSLELDETIMGSEWITAGEPASNPTSLSLLPFQERRIFDPSIPDAAYYLIEGLRGQTISIDIETGSEAGYFADIFGLDSDYHPDDSNDRNWNEVNFEKIASARSISDITDERNAGEKEPIHSEKSNVIRGSGRVVFEPRRHRFYLLRIQPRLLEGGEFLITVNSDPLLSWPLPERRREDIISFFGAPRDGGDRVHHGIDILAPRGTSLTAVDDVTISRIQVRERGGNTVFLRDSVRGYIYYYAHMDEWDADIETGDDVTTDTRLGTVGNTGNAIYSPPHLHFGIYHSSWRQPLDPWYFFIDVDDLPAERRAPQLPEENILPETITGKDTPRLSRTYYSTALFERSPAVRNKDGNTLTDREKPIMQQEWSEALYDAEADLRLVASRSGAYGFTGPGRRIVWLPRSLK